MSAHEIRERAFVVVLRRRDKASLYLDAHEFWRPGLRDAWVMDMESAELFGARFCSGVEVREVELRLLPKADAS